MRLQQTRSVSVKTAGLTIELTQAATNQTRGAFGFTDAKNRQDFRLVKAGWLQVRGKWASFSARLRAAGAEERTMLVILDGGNPMSSQATIRADIEGNRRWDALLKSSEYKINVS